MRNKRKHVDQTDKAETIARKKLAKLTKVVKPDSPAVAEIKQKVNDALESRKHANNIVDIIGHLDVTEPGATVAAAINGARRIFTTALERREVAEKDDASGGEDGSPDEKYKVWMLARLQETGRRLAGLLHHPRPAVASQALAGVMALLAAGWEAAGAGDTWGQLEKQLLQSVLLSVCSNKRDTKPAVNRLQEFIVYADVKFFLLKHLKKTISTAVTGEKANNFFIDNVLHVLEVVDMAGLAGDTVPSLLCRDRETGESTFRLDRAEAGAAFSACWLGILKAKINLTQYRRVLVMLQERVMPHLPRPLLLTDFLLTSYSVGGAISLLALSSVFTLISKHNLEFPQFYTKLYQLFTPELLHVKYRARFFHLSDVFLSSTHLPEALVAAFVKRLARLSLTAPAPTLPMVLRFIHNLLHRHQGLLVLLDSPDTAATDIDTDPFDNSASEPEASRALESSLWEVASLQRHALPHVSQAAKDLLEKGLRERELDVSALLETGWEEIMETETKKKVFPNVPINWEEPDGLKMAKDDVLSEIFTFA